MLCGPSRHPTSIAGHPTQKACMPQDSAPLPAVTASPSQMRAADPCILSVATVVPQFVLHQKDVIARALSLFDARHSDISRLMPVFENAGIATRYSCVPLEWY